MDAYAPTPLVFACGPVSAHCMPATRTRTRFLVLKDGSRRCSLRSSSKGASNPGTSDFASQCGSSIVVVKSSPSREITNCTMITCGTCGTRAIVVLIHATHKHSHAARQHRGRNGSEPHHTHRDDDAFREAIISYCTRKFHNLDNVSVDKTTGSRQSRSAVTSAWHKATVFTAVLARM